MLKKKRISGVGSCFSGFELGTKLGFVSSVAGIGWAGVPMTWGGKGEGGWRLWFVRLALTHSLTNSLTHSLTNVVLTLDGPTSENGPFLRRVFAKTRGFCLFCFR